MLATSRLKDKLFYGWVVAGTFAVIGTTILGTRVSFGVFFKSIESEFSLTRAATSTVVSMYMLFGCVFAFLGGWALDRYGPRIVTLFTGLFTGLSLVLTSQTSSPWQLFITYSLLLAIGSAPLYVVITSVISRWFDKKRGVALGIGLSGGGLGMIFLPPFATFLISNFDWRMAYIIIGVITWLIVIPLSRLLRKDPHEIGTLPDGVKKDSVNGRRQKPKIEEVGIQQTSLSLSQAFRTRSFWLFICVWLLQGSSVFLISTHLVPHATDIGISAVEAATILSLVGFISIPARLIVGAVSDRIDRKVTAMICALLQAGATAWLIWAQELWMFYLFALVFGFAFGGFPIAIGAMAGGTFGLDKLGIILGLLIVGYNIGGAIGPFIGGLIFDVSQSYFLAFSWGAAVMLLATLLIALIRRETNRNFAG
ncbi:MFS transporter [Chloroflexota bacterium]